MEGWIGSLRVAGTIYYLGWINKILQHSTGNYVQECIYRCNWIPLLYSRNEPNIVSQLYFNKTHFQKIWKVRVFHFDGVQLIQSLFSFTHSFFSHWMLYLFAFLYSKLFDYLSYNPLCFQSPLISTWCAFCFHSLWSFAILCCLNWQWSQPPEPQTSVPQVRKQSQRAESPRRTRFELFGALLTGIVCHEMKLWDSHSSSGKTNSDTWNTGLLWTAQCL